MQSSLDPGTEAYQCMGRKHFNKRDEQRPELRSRWVVQETRQTSTISVSDIAAVTSSTPPLEVVRLFCSLMMSMKARVASLSFCSFLDVSRSYPHVETLRDDFYVEAVPEMGLPEDTCLLSRRGWYGMRDAGQAFEFAVRDHFLDYDFKQGMFSSCVFAHLGKLLLYFVHGDDYVGLGVRCDLDGYKAKLSERFIIQDRGVLGADGLLETRILNRAITYHPAKPGCPEMLTYEADQRHADLLMASYGLTASSKTKATPWEKAAFLARHPLAGSFLDEERRVAFRSNCMTCLYLALDRSGIQFTAKEISRAMASPTIHADETLKALSRYLAGHPRVLWRYPRQEWPGKVWGLTDSNWAACRVTRKSSSAIYFTLGRHPIFAASSTQTILSLSSGEAEFYGAVQCACRTLGWKSLLPDLSLEVKAELATDISACKGLCSRRGAGKIRHIHCPALGFSTPWLDDRLRLLDALRETWLQMSGPRRTSPRTPCCDCWACLDWPKPRLERSRR